MHRSPPLGYNTEMKLQFSLATLLVCMTVMAVVAAVCSRYPIVDYPGGIPRTPIWSESAVRLAVFWPPSVVATFGLVPIVRRLKSRRHTEPPV